MSLEILLARVCQRIKRYICQNMAKQQSSYKPCSRTEITTSQSSSLRNSFLFNPALESDANAFVRPRSVRKSSDDSVPRLSILVKDIPAALNRGTILRNHFSQYGQITRLVPNQAKGAANITFKTAVSF